MAKKRTRQEKINAKVSVMPAVRSLPESIGSYDFNLIKRDLLKTISISGLIISGLIWLSFYLR